MISREIVQTRTYIDPKKPPEPALNYKNTYPITVYEAVKETWEEGAKTLGQELFQIQNDLKNKQHIFPGKPSNYLMTYAGEPGAVGSIQLTSKIPWKTEDQSQERVPTEKAVGQYLLSIGVLDKYGNPLDTKKYRWDDIIGRPIAYDELGTNDNGFITQRALTSILNSMTSSDELLKQTLKQQLEVLELKIDEHRNNDDNPHRVTPGQIGAVSRDVFFDHAENYMNPHHVTKEQVGLDRVNNTSDDEKPVSQPVKDELQKLSNGIKSNSEKLEETFVNATYSMELGKLSLYFRNGQKIMLNMPIHGLVMDIRYDKEKKELLLYKVNGEILRLSALDLFVRYNAKDTETISLKVVTNDEHQYEISATILPNSITDKQIKEKGINNISLADNSVDNHNLVDNSIHSEKYKDRSIHSNKIAIKGIRNENIDDRAVTSHKLFSSAIPNRILGVTKAGSSPIYLQANSDMIGEKAIQNKHMDDDSIAKDQLQDNAVVTSKLYDRSVTYPKLSVDAVHTENIQNDAVTSDKIARDLSLKGNPKLESHPSENDNDNSIVDSFWINRRIENFVFSDKNIPDRLIDGRMLFSAGSSNKVLLTKKANTNPEWDVITNLFIADDAIEERNIKDRSVTNTKIDDSAIRTNHILTGNITTDLIATSAITKEKIYTSEQEDMILASLAKDGHPEYTKLNLGMIPDGLLNGKKMGDHSIDLIKLETSPRADQVLTVRNAYGKPEWMKIRNQMIGDYEVDGRTLFTSTISNRVLGVAKANGLAEYLQINEHMIDLKQIKSHHLDNNSVISRHIVDEAIKNNHIAERCIEARHIMPRTITGGEIFTSPIPNRVLAITGIPYSDVQYTQITSDMIEDQAVTRDKIFRSRNSYRVLGVTEATRPPEYLMITSDFIVDNSIIPEKLVNDFVLYGSPRITKSPPVDSYGEYIPDTKWVMDRIKEAALNPPASPPSAEFKLERRMIKGEHLFSSNEEGPRVLGVTAKGEDPEYLLVERDMLAGRSVTSDKLGYDLLFMGTPSIQKRPFASASDQYGGGDLVPDCQWVLDAIRDENAFRLKYDDSHFLINSKGLALNIASIFATDSEISEMMKNLISSILPGGGGSGGGSSSPAVILPGAIHTEHIDTRAVTPDKLFVSSDPNMVLGVLQPNTSPSYLKVNSEMLGEGSVTLNKISPSNAENKILGVKNANEHPSYITINEDMIDPNSITSDLIKSRAIKERHLSDESVSLRTIVSSTEDNRILGVKEKGQHVSYVTINGNMVDEDTLTEKHFHGEFDGRRIKKNTITNDRLVAGPVIDNEKLFDRSVSSRKIELKAITDELIADEALNPKKMREDIPLRRMTTIEADTKDTYQKRKLRNTIISEEAPHGGEPGDIWLRII